MQNIGELIEVIACEAPLLCGWQNKHFGVAYVLWIIVLPDNISSLVKQRQCPQITNA